MLNFFKWAYPSLCFSIFVSAILYNLRVNFRQCSDLNHGPLVSEANTLPTVPQPLPQQFIKLDDGFNKTQEKCFRYFFLQSFASETKLWFTFRPQEKNSIFFRWLITSWWRHRFLSRPKKFLLLRSKVTHCWGWDALWKNFAKPVGGCLPWCSGGTTSTHPLTIRPLTTRLHCLYPTGGSGGLAP